MSKKKLKQGQIFTPPWVTNEMLDLIGGDKVLSDDESFFFEPTCGDGQMLIVIVERIYKALLAKYDGDIEKALSETLFKFYASELDETLIPPARMRVWQFAAKEIKRELSLFEQYLIAHQLQQSIECRDALKESIDAIDSCPGMRALKRMELKRQKSKKLATEEAIK